MAEVVTDAPGLDLEMSAYVERVNGFYPPDAVDLDIAGQRKHYDRLCVAFNRAHPQGVATEDGTLPGPAGALRIRRYRRSLNEGPATILYFHGGGFVLGGLDSHDSVCAELCGATGHRVVAVEYRLSPEHIHPAHHDDALAAFRALIREERPVVLAGDSAGGALAASVALATRGEPRAAIGQLLIYPGLGGESLGLASYTEHAEAIHLTADDVAYYRRMRAGGEPRLHDWTFAPLWASSLAHLPPCVAVSADIDPLRDDAAEYVRRLQAAHVRARWLNERGLVHGFLRARLMSRRAQAAFDRICDAASRLGRGEGL